MLNLRCWEHKIYFYACWYFSAEKNLLHCCFQFYLKLCQPQFQRSVSNLCILPLKLSFCLISEFQDEGNAFETYQSWTGLFTVSFVRLTNEWQEGTWFFLRGTAWIATTRSQSTTNCNLLNNSTRDVAFCTENLKSENFLFIFPSLRYFEPLCGLELLRPN